VRSCCAVGLLSIRHNQTQKKRAVPGIICSVVNMKKMHCQLLGSDGLHGDKNVQTAGKETKSKHGFLFNAMECCKRKVNAKLSFLSRGKRDGEYVIKSL
jgi:hypothetical protein